MTETTPSDTIRTRLAFAYEAAETEEDRAWVNEGQEALAMMEAEMARLRGELTEIVEGSSFNQQRFAEDTDTDYFMRCFRAVKEQARQALAQPGDAA